MGWGEDPLRAAHGRDRHLQPAWARVDELTAEVARLKVELDLRLGVIQTLNRQLGEALDENEHLSTQLEEIRRQRDRSQELANELQGELNKRDIENAYLRGELNARPKPTGWCPG